MLPTPANYLSLATSLLQKGSLWLVAREDASVMMEMLQCEIEYNLNLINTLSEDANQWSPACVAIGSHIKTDYISSAFAPGKASSRLRELLHDVQVTPDGDEEQEKSVAKSATVGEALQIVLVRMYSIQALAKIEKRPDGMREIRFATRLRNLGRDLENIRIALKHHK